MEADQLAGKLREKINDDIVGWPYDRESDPEFAGGSTETGHEDTCFFVVVDGGRFLVTVAKVSE